MSQPQFPCRVGDVVIAGTFRVSPEALTVHSRSQLQSSATSVPGAMPGALRSNVAPTGELPASLLVANAVARVSSAGMFHGYNVRPAHTGRARVLSRPALGEPVTVVATVRYRSVRQSVAHVTFLVELRRRSGQIVTRFEFGVDLREDEFDESIDELRAA